MHSDELRLGYVAEEANEVSIAIHKILRFRDNKHPLFPDTSNETLFWREVADLHAAIETAVAESLLTRPEDDEWEAMLEKSFSKREQFHQIAMEAQPGFERGYYGY